VTTAAVGIVLFMRKGRSSEKRCGHGEAGNQARSAHRFHLL